MERWRRVLRRKIAIAGYGTLPLDPTRTMHTARIEAALCFRLQNTRGWVPASEVITTGAGQPSLDAGEDFNWVNYLA